MGTQAGDDASTRARIEHALGLPTGSILRSQVVALDAKVQALAAVVGRPRGERLRAERCEREHIERLMGLPAGVLSAPAAVSTEALDASGWLRPGASARVALLAFEVPVALGEPVQLLPARDFTARDGRPGAGKAWRIDDISGPGIARKLTAVAALTPVVIDYDHQTLHTATNGMKAPAAGWIHSASWLPGRGLFAAVDWTAAARAYIAAGEYRFTSSVIQADPEFRVTDVVMASLVNLPAVVGMAPVTAPHAPLAVNTG